MKFLLCEGGEAADIIANRINSALGRGPVLFLVSGGSNIELACEVRRKLNIKDRLTIGLTDERYGSPGHADSNWEKLLAAGFELDGVEQLPVLTGLDFNQTLSQYRNNLEAAFKNSRIAAGLFGMGSDGHTSGVLPASPAVTEPSLVSGYDGADFRRITTTPTSFKLFDIAFLSANGDDKRAQIEKLAGNEISVSTQPAQALKQAKEFIILNDQIGERTDSP